MEELRPRLDDHSLDAVERLNALFAGSRRFKRELAPQMRRAFDVIFRPENVVLFHRIDRAVTEIAAPVIAEIIAEGSRTGRFDAPDPQAFAEMLLQFRLSFATAMHRAIQQAEAGDIDEAVRVLDKRLRLYGIAVDRVLKLPDGTIEVAEPGFARALLATDT